MSFGGKGRSGGGGGGYGGQRRQVVDSTVRRLNAPKKDPKGYGRGRIDGLHQGYFEYAGHLFKVTITGCKDAKSEFHTGWVKIEDRGRA